MCVAVFGGGECTWCWGEGGGGWGGEGGRGDVTSQLWRRLDAATQHPGRVTCMLFYGSYAQRYIEGSVQYFCMCVCQLLSCPYSTTMRYISHMYCILCIFHLRTCTYMCTYMYIYNYTYRPLLWLWLVSLSCWRSTLSLITGDCGSLCVSQSQGPQWVGPSGVWPHFQKLYCTRLIGWL